jgi:hypothetical protein
LKFKFYTKNRSIFHFSQFLSKPVITCSSLDDFFLGTEACDELAPRACWDKKKRKKNQEQTTVDFHTVADRDGKL